MFKCVREYPSKHVDLLTWLKPDSWVMYILRFSADKLTRKSSTTDAHQPESRECPSVESQVAGKSPS